MKTSKTSIVRRNRLLFAFALAAFATQIDATTVNSPLGPRPSASMPTLDPRALPHGRCPTNYQLEFVQNRWIRCPLANKTMASTTPRFSVPICDPGYKLQDAASSGAPERNLFRCVKNP
jgi:hypothetical protein